MWPGVKFMHALTICFEVMTSSIKAHIKIKKPLKTWTSFSSPFRTSQSTTNH